MKLSNAKHAHINKSFLKTKDCEVTTLKEGHKITGFKARYKTVEKEFLITNQVNHKKAWQQMER